MELALDARYARKELRAALAVAQAARPPSPTRTSKGENRPGRSTASRVDAGPAAGPEELGSMSLPGSIVVARWRTERTKCSVVRFWDGTLEHGHLIRKPGGSWAFHYDILGDESDDETGYRFGDHTFRIGEYVSIKEHDDVMRTFRVVSISDS